MKNITDKTKKRLVITGGLAISAVLVILISGAFRTPATDDVNILDSSTEPQSIVVETPDTTEKENKIVVPDIEIPQETENTHGNDKGTDQTIQSDIPQKPTYTAEELTNPEQKPNREKVDKPTEENPTPPQTQDKPAEKPNNPTGGLPGFDNVPNMGDNQTIKGDSDGDINKQVGIMD
ncbi:DUF6550 family protein [Hydrogenoanaerobacterium sp.]|uniref:DUF6550 family protein n=1 Tax=Hydrogenoanaerobacterium sp. TaxID=2953763 RepID=UPI0028A11624|nr:DUF6550 family protein [Hydrogenoanaerobacterium sp.]